MANANNGKANLYKEAAEAMFYIGGIVDTLSAALAIDLSKGKNALLIGTSIANLIAALTDIGVIDMMQQSKNKELHISH